MNCAFGLMPDPRDVAHELDQVVGVVEHGLFLGFATEARIGGRDGVGVLKKTFA